MQTVKSKQQVRSASMDWKRQDQFVALVPTMGNLHDGHLKLVETARQYADKVIVSIFVNPMQFGEHEDFGSYPRTLEQDSTLLAEQGVDLLFSPDVGEVYPENTDALTRVEVPGLSTELCGKSRPGHFNGVTTVVAKLFNMVQPDLAVFGEKDYQQLFLIKKMVADLDFPLRIQGVPTVREPDGLAMSSRNAYLDAQQRRCAPLLYKALQNLRQRLLEGREDLQNLQESAVKFLENEGFVVDYVSIRRVDNLQPAVQGDQQLVILAAAWLGKARLIDNILV
jgi:pantoate--beta-alanine ligase